MDRIALRSIPATSWTFAGQLYPRCCSARLERVDPLPHHSCEGTSLHYQLSTVCRRCWKTPTSSWREWEWLLTLLVCLPELCWTLCFRVRVTLRCWRTLPKAGFGRRMRRWRRLFPAGYALCIAS